jgi:hypothetical protein
MNLQGEEIGEQLSINEIADAYSKAVPPRIVAEKLMVKEDDAVSIEAERVLFRKFIVDTYEQDNLEFPSQGVAWEAYTWDLEEWVEGRNNYSLEKQESPDTSYWTEHFYNELNSQIRSANYDENGGQQ